MNENGVVTAEYGILAGFIAAVIVVAVAAFGGATVALFTIPDLLDALVPNAAFTGGHLVWRDET
ncbi:Flp family type IVb pilin [Kineosporiaceae bacterium SCSIO 59966]|nr:Flp family type IVb pilin [Kineosporiaceae bacterium SCSIO 59966]